MRGIWVVCRDGPAFVASIAGAAPVICLGMVSRIPLHGTHATGSCTSHRGTGSSFEV